MYTSYLKKSQKTEDGSFFIHLAGRCPFRSFGFVIRRYWK